MQLRSGDLRSLLDSGPTDRDDVPRPIAAPSRRGKVRIVRYGLVLASLLLAPGVCAAQLSSQSDPIIIIDGAKNPELIPQWSVWSSAFRYMAKDDIDKLPTVVLRAVTPEQSKALMKDANALAAYDEECNLRAAEMGKKLLAEKPDLSVDLVNARVIEAAMPCRRHTLDARDKWLARLSPDGATALSGWVESLKAGRTTTLRKSQLKAYLLPE